MGDDVTVLDEEGQQIEPGSGQIGMVARSGRLPLGYYRGRREDRRAFQGVQWQTLGRPRRLRHNRRRRGASPSSGEAASASIPAAEKVFPEEVEEALKAHTDIIDALVVAVPDTPIRFQGRRRVQHAWQQTTFARRSEATLSQAHRGVQGFRGRSRSQTRFPVCRAENRTTHGRRRSPAARRPRSPSNQAPAGRGIHVNSTRKRRGAFFLAIHVVGSSLGCRVSWHPATSSQSSTLAVRWSCTAARAVRRSSTMRFVRTSERISATEEKSSERRFSARPCLAVR